MKKEGHSPAWWCTLCLSKSTLVSLDEFILWIRMYVSYFEMFFDPRRRPIPLWCPTYYVCLSSLVGAIRMVWFLLITSPTVNFWIYRCTFGYSGSIHLIDVVSPHAKRQISASPHNRKFELVLHPNSLCYKVITLTREKETEQYDLIV